MPGDKTSYSPFRLFNKNEIADQKKITQSYMITHLRKLKMIPNSSLANYGLLLFEHLLSVSRHVLRDTG